MEQQRVEQQVKAYEAAYENKQHALKEKWNLEDEIAAIKRQMEEEAASQVSAKTDIPKMAKILLAEHTRHSEAVIRLHEVDLLLMSLDCEAEAAKMRAWSTIAYMQSRQITLEEIHDHTVV